MKKTGKLILPISVLLLLVMLFSAVGVPTISAVETYTDLGAAPYINLVDGIDINESDYFDSSVVQKLPDGIGKNETISIIIRTKSQTLLDAYQASGSGMTFSEFSKTEEAERLKAQIKAEKDAIIARLDETTAVFDEGDEYNTVLAGFEITLKAKHYDTVCDAVGSDGSVILGDVYNVSETQYVENKVDVYGTGIFNSSGFGFDGTGMLVAVLDTGIDYTHSAFNNFGVADRNDPSLGLTFEKLEALIGTTAAAGINPGLSAADVFVSNKIPFGFDYADSDSEIYPLRSDHGTHVSGIIAGKDDTITGVAPGAQIIGMKIFSDVMDTARSSWILSALEDCVILGVDVINLSIGTTCGFSTPSERELTSGVYDKIREAGISLVVAASNSFNSGYGSEKNGNLDLTSNPDTGTVGSPSTYNGALCVASVEGEKTAYLLHDGNIVYFTEASDKRAEKKDFVDELLAKHGGQSSIELEFVTIRGVGRLSDYNSVDVKGKIALVRRGTTTFEEKAKAAAEAGAAGIIVYNNVSGEISMNVGTVDIPACSISQDDGERLASANTGTLKIALDQAAGPFMSNFSSWGPSPDLELKPEITAHGGSIESAVPGQEYDRISGTSMACPNVSGVVALLRQYIKDKYPALEADTPENNKQVTAMINRLLMSTADIVYNMNGLAYSPRKQGAGLANLKNAAATGAYILTYDRKDGSVMDKSKIELGDDPSKTGVYKLKFTVDNFGDKTVSYDISTYVMTEGVSETLTDRLDSTVSQDGYLLEGCGIAIRSLGGGSLVGNNITVSAGEKATIEITVTLTEENKKYLDESFENGMYVEGFVSLDAKDENTVDLSVPYLAFYGDWTQAPLFDIDYYETNKDELDDGKDDVQKTLADAYATRPIGGISSDYVNYLGAYPYEQKPGTTKIAADRKYISLSNQSDAINSLRFVWAGMLRGAERIEISITEDSTGNVIFSAVDEYIRKSYSDGGVMIYPANIDIEFSAIENNLKNNTSYTVTLKGYLDYCSNDCDCSCKYCGGGGETDECDCGGADTNLNNTFTFPLVADFSAPTVTDCQFYTEYDKSTKKNRLYAKIGVYDNHYAMAAMFGYAQSFAYTDENGTPANQLTFVNFDEYLTQIYSGFNQTTYMIYELTDHIDSLKNNADNKNSFSIALYDFALNVSMYEIALPDEYTDFYFDTKDFGDVTELSIGSGRLYTLEQLFPGVNPDDIYSINVTDKIEKDGDNIYLKDNVAPGTVATITLRMKDKTSRTLYIRATDKRITSPVIEKMAVLSPNETFNLSFLIYPDTEWGELLLYSSSGTAATVIGNEILALQKGVSKISAQAIDGSLIGTAGSKKDVSVLVLGEGDDGYKKYTKPVVQSFNLSGYHTNKAYYFMNSEDRDIGKTGDDKKFDGAASLSMYPSESVTLKVDYVPYFKNSTSLSFTSSNPKIVSVDENGTIVAHSEGYASITVTVVMDGKNTIHRKSVDIEVKDPYVSSGPMLQNYYGNGGVVVIPEELCLTDIGQFAFSNYDYVEKDPSEITEEDTETTKMWYIGDDTITEIVIPEGVERIGMYAFANLTALTKVTLPSTLKSISNGAFYGCKNLKTVEGLENVKFINREAFAGCNLSGELNLENAVAISDYAFAFLDFGDGRSPSLEAVIFGENTKSIASYAFAGNTKLERIEIKADKINIGKYAFALCEKLESVEINAPVISAGAFQDCKSLKNVTLGKDVELIGEFAFAGTDVTGFTVDSENSTFYATQNEPFILSKDGTKILLVAPTQEVIDLSAPEYSGITSIETGAFSGNTVIKSIIAPYVTSVGNYAFADCSNLESVSFAPLALIGDYAFYGTKLDVLPEFSSELKKIGSYAFALTKIKSVEIPDGTAGAKFEIGAYAFAECDYLETIIIGDYVKIGSYAFYTGTNRNARPDRWEMVKFTVGENEYVYYKHISPLTTLKIGTNADIGEGAFWGASELEEIELGAGAVIGAGAFYQADSLSRIDLSGVISIGQWAFAGGYDYYYHAGGINGVGDPVINKDGTDGVRIWYTPNFESINLSSVTKIDAEAFLYCGYVDPELNRPEAGGLKTVILGESAKEIMAGAFAACTQLSSINLENVEIIGEYAFALTALTFIDLTSAKEIGADAFASCDKLTTVKFGEYEENGAGISIGTGAFSYCTALQTVINLGSVSYIGDNAFAYSALPGADLTNAVYVGSYAFYKSSPAPFALILGEKLADMGDNPFPYCIISPVSKETTVDIGGGITKTELIYTFDIGEYISIIDGSIYLKVPNGLELITYIGNDKTVTVAEGTVRISASAFRGASDLVSVVLPKSLISIGHKAFFDCASLKLITFNSLNAPILEEEYDESYATADNVLYLWQALDYYGFYVGYNTGLGIKDYYNLNPSFSTFFYGANFKNYIGKVSDKLTMVRPANGKNYESFIFEQYFDFIVDGVNVANDITISAIEAISKIPNRITLSDKTVIEEARAAYDKIKGSDQLGIAVAYLGTLTRAEERIAELEALNNPDTPSEPDTNPGTNPGTPDTAPDTPQAAPDAAADASSSEKGGVTMALTLTVSACALVLGVFIGVMVIVIAGKKNRFD